MFSIQSKKNPSRIYISLLDFFNDSEIDKLKAEIVSEIYNLESNIILIIQIGENCQVNNFWVNLEQYTGKLTDLGITKVIRIIGNSKVAFEEFATVKPNFENIEVEYLNSIEAFEKKITSRDLTKVYRPINGIETNFEVRTCDTDISLEEYLKLPKHKIYIILDNLRSAFNVGAIFRLCDTMRVSALMLCGYTAHPPNKKIIKTSLGTIDFVPWMHFDRATEAVDFLHQHNIPVWAAETTSLAEKYNEIDVPNAVGIVFGNEALGVGEDVMKLCDKFVEIPTFGYKNSLNVAASCSVIGYRIVQEMQK